MANQLLPIQDPKPAELFAPGGLDHILAKIEEQARSIVVDTSTVKGRKEVASVAARVARSKTYLDDLGKEFVAGLKQQTKAVDNVRKDARDRLDALRDEVRKPLNDWEAEEEKRKAEHERRIDAMDVYMRASTDNDLSLVETSLELAKKMPAEADAWDEYAEHALPLREQTIKHLERVIERRKQMDAEAEELRKLRAEAAMREAREARQRAEQEQKEREQRIAAEAAEQEKARAEKARKDYEAEVARKEKQAAAEAARKIAEAERKAKEAEEAAKAAEEKAKREVEEKAQKQRAEEKRKAANKAHRGRVNTRVRQALKDEVGLSDEQAMTFITAIEADKVPNLKIIY